MTTTTADQAIRCGVGSPQERFVQPEEIVNVIPILNNSLSTFRGPSDSVVLALSLKHSPRGCHQSADAADRRADSMSAFRIVWHRAHEFQSY